MCGGLDRALAMGYPPEPSRGFATPCPGSPGPKESPLRSQSNLRAPLGAAFCRGALAFLFMATVGCGSAMPVASTFPPLAQKWFDRASASYHKGDIEDAGVAVDNALRITPKREDARLLGARIALANLEYDRCIQLVEGLEKGEARGLRGRALWYSGELEKAADELELLLADPEERDPWARDIAKLARRGAGRTPFTISGGLLAAVEMPMVGHSALVVPLEVNGEPALGLVATNVSETTIDSSTGAEPSWISLRFGEKLEVKDVPALAQDLSGLSRMLNAPIKLLLGVNLLRHINPTMDFLGHQFVARSFEPPPPPNSTTVKLTYLRGGGMLMRSAIGAGRNAPPVSLLVDTSLAFPVALDDGGWKAAGISPSKLEPVSGAPGLKQGTLSFLHVGAYEIPQVPAVHSKNIADMEKVLDVDIDGLLGGGLIAAFRATLTDRGRTLWLEDMPNAGGGAPQDEAAPGGATEPGQPVGGLAPPQLAPPAIDGLGGLETPAEPAPNGSPIPRPGAQGGSVPPAPKSTVPSGANSRAQ